MKLDMRSIYRSPSGAELIRAWCNAQLDGWPVPHERRVMATSAGETHLVLTGAGAPAVVLVPGTNANAATNLIAAGVLAERWPTLIVDLPGQAGLSGADRPRHRRHRLGWYGRWLREVLAGTGAEGAVVIGHSLGGAIALACDSPRIAGRVLLNTAGLTRPALPAAVLRATLPWVLCPNEQRSASLLRLFLAPGRLPPSPMIEWYTLVARHCRFSLPPARLPAGVLAQRQDVPCLVATGRHDAFLSPARLRGPARSGLDARLEVAGRSGHLITDEQPELVASLTAAVAREAVR